LGVLLYGEAFPASRAYGFIAIWIALAIYVADSLLRPAVAKENTVEVGVAERRLADIVES
jgi:hypothetical protein